MNQRNVKLQRCFWHGREYSSSKDNRAVEIFEFNDGRMEIRAKLHKSTIAKRCGHNLDEIHVSYAGWKTRTTSMAIAALLPAGWRYSNGHVLSPRGAVIPIPINGYLKLLDPVSAHEESWNSEM